MATVDKPATAAPKAVSTTRAKAVPSKQAKVAKLASNPPAKAAKSVAQAETPTPGKTHAKPRAKLVRDSFTMPQQDFDLIDLLKSRALGLQRPAKKSELLRAGLQALAALPAAKLKERLDKLELLKTGRPKKSG